MSELLGELEALRERFDGAEQRKLLDILIHIAHELGGEQKAQNWHALEVEYKFQPLDHDQVMQIMADPGGPQIIVKGDPATARAAGSVAYAAMHPDYVPPKQGGNGNGQSHG